MGYAPSVVARSLKTRQSRALGVVVTNIADPFLSEVVRGVEEAALDAGYSLLLAASNHDPRTHLTSGGFSTMGFTVPAALGAQLAFPDRQVVGCAGAGDFMQTMQEMVVAVMYNLPVLFLALNNSGFISIKGGQMHNFGRTTVVDFQKKDGSLYSPNFCEAARAFGLHPQRISTPDEIQLAMYDRRAALFLCVPMSSGCPALMGFYPNRRRPREVEGN